MGAAVSNEPLTRKKIVLDGLQLINDTDDWTEDGCRVVDVLSALRLADEKFEKYHGTMISADTALDILYECFPFAKEEK